MSDPLLDIDEARARVVARAEPGAVEIAPLREACGRALAEDLQSPDPVPGFDSSAMDGFALRSADTETAGPGRPVRLRIADESRAGVPASGTVSSGEAVAISTGAMVPAGADAVVRVEDTALADGHVSVEGSVTAGANLRRAGDDISPGAVVLRAGTRLGPAELGVLASIGQAEVPCFAIPSLAVLTTGDELLEAGDELRPGTIRDSNSYSLPALAAAAGAEVTLTESVPDAPEATRGAIRRALDLAGVVVISGGVSVGEHDHVRGALESLGVEEEFWGIALKPGKPTWFGRSAAGTLVFGLPGNPVSSMVTFLLLVRPALLRSAGLETESERAPATLAAPARGEPGRAHAVRCRLSFTENGLAVTPTAENQGSHVLTSMLGADCLAILSAGKREWRAGDPVEIELLPGGLDQGSSR